MGMRRSHSSAWPWLYQCAKGLLHDTSWHTGHDPIAETLIPVERIVASLSTQHPAGRRVRGQITENNLVAFSII